MKNIRNVFRLGAILTARDARLVVEACAKRNLRAGSQNASHTGESIEVYMPLKNVGGEPQIRSNVGESLFRGMWE